MHISVVIPTYNRLKIVLRTLETLFEQDISPAEYELIVVVDGSTDGTADRLRHLRPLCHLHIIEQENRGLAGARNTGYRAAKSDLVLFLDDDMRCERNLLATHIDVHKRLTRAVAFGTILLSDDSPTCLASECFKREVGALHLEHQTNPSAKWQMKDCIFGHASLPRELLIEAGGFDESFRMREDLEFGIRLFQLGANPVYVDRAIAYQHYEKKSPDLIRDAEAFALADVQLARKHPQFLIKGQLSWLAQEPGWKHRLRRIISAQPWIADFVLAPICAMSELFIQVPLFCRIGVRTLKLRRSIHWFHTALESGWEPLKSDSRLGSLSHP